MNILLPYEFEDNEEFELYATIKPEEIVEFCKEYYDIELDPSTVAKLMDAELLDEDAFLNDDDFLLYMSDEREKEAYHKWLNKDNEDY